MKRKVLKVILLCIFILSQSVLTLASDKKIGTTAASFLKIPCGARAVAMGGTFGAVADDATAAYWNPAGLGQLTEREVNLTYLNYIEGMGFGYLGYVHPTRVGTLGGAISYLGHEEIEGYDEYARPTGGYKAHDSAIALSYGRGIGEKLLVGGSIKYISERIENASATGYGVDLGVLYKLSKLRLGLAVQNIGTEQKFIKEGFPLPLNIKAGIAYPYKTFLFALDANKPIDNEINLSFGVESWWFKMLALRAGYKLGRDNRLSEHTGIATGWSAGAGFNFKPLQFDAAYVPYGDLGDTVRISLLFRF